MIIWHLQVYSYIPYIHITAVYMKAAERLGIIRSHLIPIERSVLITAFCQTLLITIGANDHHFAVSRKLKQILI